MIPHNKSFISKSSLSLVKKTITSGWVNYGKISYEVEQKLSKLIYNKKNCSILSTNGTSSIFIALKALGIKKGDEVIIPSYTCTALLNAINLINATAIICDISKKNLSFTKKLLIPLVTNKTKAIIVVHTFGIPCELKKIGELNIPIIEDCSQSLGSRFEDGSYTGSKGNISIFSFYATKLITGGLGGAILSKDKKIMKFVKDYIDFDMPDEYKERFNFQISDINSSLILVGLKELDKVLKVRRYIAKEYLKVCNNKYNGSKRINNFRFILNFDTYKDLEKCKVYLEENSIKTIIPITHNELLHNYLNINKKKYKNSEEVSNTLLSIPIFPSLTKNEISHIKRSLNDYFSTSTSI